MTLALIKNDEIEQVGLPAEKRSLDARQLADEGWVKVQGSPKPDTPVDPGYYHAFGAPYAYADGEVTGTWTVQKRPQPYPSWTWVEGEGWVAPVPMPNDGQEYTWDEATQSWVVSEMAE